MPTYVYKREDGTTFEIRQKMTDSVLETCPTTGQPVKRMIGAGAGLIFKGDGFYITDYARKEKPAEAKSATESDGKPVVGANGEGATPGTAEASSGTGEGGSKESPAD